MLKELCIYLHSSFCVEKIVEYNKCYVEISKIINKKVVIMVNKPFITVVNYAIITIVIIQNGGFVHETYKNYKQN